MRLTDVLVRSVAVHGPSAWWHSTNQATLLVGPSAHRAHRLDAPVGIRLVRRPTGGGAVLVGPGVLGLDVALPRTHPLLTGDVTEDYRWLGAVWATALTQLAIPARSIGIDESRSVAAVHREYADVALACFGIPAPYEVVSGDRKLVGMSQVRRSGGVLFSSAVHVDVSPCSVASALPLTTSRRKRLAHHLTRYAGSLADASPQPVTPFDVRRAFRSSLLALNGIKLRDGRWPQGPTVEEILDPQP